jgi:ADP-heptose:LPS heptosyltransferase
MASETSRTDDPISLSPLAFIKRAARLPLREVGARLARLAISLPASAVAIARANRRAAALGKTPVYILLTGRMGDLIATEPVIRHIRQPGDYIIWLSRPRYAGVLTFNPYVDEIRLVSSDFEASLLMRLFRGRRWINLLLHETRCNVFGTKLKNPNIFGITAYNRYAFGSNADVFALLGTGAKLSDRPRLYFDPAFDAKSYLASIFPAGGPVLVFHPSSDEFARSWAADKIQNFATWLLANTEFNLLELGMPPLLQSGPRVFNLTDRLTLPRQFAVIAAAQLFAGCDSGFSHAANAAAVPSILLLGAHLGFSNQQPLPVHSQDIILRGSGQTYEIEVSDVTDAVGRLSARISSARPI